MVRFVDDDHVEEIVRKLSKPFVDVGSELLDIRDDDVGLGCN